MYERKRSNYAQGFLDTAECRVINTVYHQICEYWVEKGTIRPVQALQSIEEIEEEDIVSIRGPTVFTGYHFILAVIGKKTVDIYQSYGYSRPLYRIGGIGVGEFKRLVANMQSLENNESGMEKMREIEEKIYGTNYEEQIKRELREINRSGDSDGIKIEREELETELYQKNVVQTAADFQMAVYKFVRSECKRPTVASRKRKRESNGSKSTSQPRNLKKRRKTQTRTKTKTNTK